MKIIAPALALAIVALAIGLAAVSAYASPAASDEETALPVNRARVVYEPWDGIERLDPGKTAALIPANPLAQDDGAVSLMKPRSTPGAETSEAITRPTVELRYAAPSDAGGVAPAAGPRSDLSPGAKVWNVTSIKPGQTLDAFAEGDLDIPPDQLAVMKQVDKISGVPWQVLAAIAKVESNFGRNMSTSSAGAIGYGQFLPQMWAIFGEGGDPYDYRDVLPAMARYLIVANSPYDMPGAIHAYNHDWDYVSLVLSIAATYGYPEEISLAGLAWPSVGPISTYYSSAHRGIDIDQTMRPGAPVTAAHNGVVAFAGGNACCSYGRYVTLTGPNGVTTLYGHFKDIYVETGDWVRRGQPLGAIGCTGVCTGTHLHLEVMVNGQYRNPLDLLP